jgi:FAD:protein FMN transferase
MPTEGFFNCHLVTLLLLFASSACNPNKNGTKPLAMDMSGALEHSLQSVAQIGRDDPLAINEMHHFFQEIMGTHFKVQIASYHQKTALAAARIAFNEVRRIEHLMSSWRADSELGQLNKAAGKHAVSISYETAWLLCKSKAINKLTRGAFDITWATLKGLWHFKTRSIPEHKALQRRLTFVGSQHLLLTFNDHRGQPRQCTHLNSKAPHPVWTKYETPPPEEWSWQYQAKLDQPETQIDLGGIAKGFAVDNAARFLKRLGFQDFVVDGGGDLLVEGRDLSEQPWSVGIQHPRTDQLWGELWVPSGWSVVTSGDYEKFFYHKTQRYHHIIDLRTGYPAQGSVAMTVIAESALLADALATALFVLGPYEGVALADSISGLEAICFTPTGEVITSQGAHIFSPTLRKRWRE